MELFPAITDGITAPRTSACGWLRREVREGLTLVQRLAAREGAATTEELRNQSGIGNLRFDQLMGRLIGHGLVRRSPDGFELARRVEEISLGQVIDAAMERPVGLDLGLGSLGLELRAWLDSRTVEELVRRA